MVNKRVHYCETSKHICFLPSIMPFRTRAPVIEAMLEFFICLGPCNRSENGARAGTAQNSRQETLMEERLRCGSFISILIDRASKATQSVLKETILHMCTDTAGDMVSVLTVFK